MYSSSEERVLERVRQGDRTVLKDLYKKHRMRFIRWVQRRYSHTQDEIAEVYQQVFTIFYFNVKEGKFKGDSAIETYMFGIGKNLINKTLSKGKQAISPIDDVEEIDVPTESGFSTYERTHEKLLVKNILDKVGEPCKSILTKYYYDNFTMEAIAENLGYKNAMVVKKKKCECLIKIRETLKEKRKKVGLTGEG